MNILLVHGGVHKGNCWDALVPYLKKLDFKVSAIDLRGHGRNSTFYYDVTLQNYAEDICLAAERLGSPCVVVGHSMGGIAISAAAEMNPSLFSHLIFLTALVPSKQYPRFISLGKRFVNPGDKKSLKISLLKGCITPRANYLQDYFYNDCPPIIKSNAENYLCNQPLRPLFGKVKLTKDGIGSIPKHYIECTQDLVMPIAGQRELQKHMEFESITSLKSGHSPFLSMPNELADCISNIIKPNL